MTREKYAIWLAERPGLSPELRLRLMDRLGSAEAVYRAGEQEYRDVHGVGKRQLEALSQKGTEHADIILRDCAKYHIRVVTIEDEAYPQPLRDLSDAPLVLYVRGTLPNWERTVAIGMVGTRRATSYGRGAAHWIAGQLAMAGCVVVSGMALGIDGEANRGALDAGGMTIAVLGCGLDICYPPAHQKLMEDIVAGGAVISEYPPGTEPRGLHFPQRNRIMSGLCRGVIVIEAPKKSGALITADRALDQGRDVFGVPGNINSPQSAGVNQLLREGGAELITCAADVLSHYPEESKWLTPVPQAHRPAKRKPEPKPQKTPAPKQEASAAEPSKPPKTDIALSEEEKAVLRSIQDGADCVDAIIESSGLTASQTLACLTMLEINGCIRRTGATVQIIE